MKAALITEEQIDAIQSALALADVNPNFIDDALAIVRSLKVSEPIAWRDEAATELRRLHEVNQELMKAIAKGLDLPFDNEIAWFEWRDSAEVALSKATGESAETFGKPDIGIADPCPQCRRGGVCRTMTCRRLQLPVDHPYRNQAFAYSQPEQDHGFDRTASHMAGEYVDTAEQETVVDRRLKIKLGRQYGSALGGHWFYLQPADEYADQALTNHSGYTTPPRKEWVGLTDDDYPSIRDGDHAFHAGWTAAEAKLRSKNETL